MLLNDAVEIITSQTKGRIDLQTIADNEYPGWVPAKWSDHLDIKLVNAVDMLKIEVVNGSNVKKFELLYEDINENIVNKTVIKNDIKN